MEMHKLLLFFVTVITWFNIEPMLPAEMTRQSACIAVVMF